MKPFGIILVSVTALALLLLGCTSQTPPGAGGNQTAGAACIQQNGLCGYGTISPASAVANQSTFYGRCCQGLACIEGNCKNMGDGCVANNKFCGYGPVNLAHYEAPTYYGECCEGECVNGYCTKQCKITGSCSNASDCCSGYECREGQCRQPCKNSGSCSSNSDCCAGYFCNQSMQCAKPCATSGPCAKNADCCPSFFCGSNMQCILEPKCVPNRGYCNNTGQCCSGLACVDGVCANTSCGWGTACNSTSQCCAGLYCGQNGICNPQKCTEVGGVCNITADCCFNRRCENNTCMNMTCALLNESCVSLSCCQGFSCLNYQCSVPCKISGVCSRESDCCQGYYCSVNGYCAKLGACIYEYAECNETVQCCSGLKCTNGTCSKPCKYSGPCASNVECCVGYFCNSTMHCALQPTTPPLSAYDLCERECTALGYNNWLCDPETSCGMWGAHLAAGDAGCPTAYHDWSYPNNEFCCCNNRTEYDCSSACQRGGYANGWGTVSSPSKCGQSEGTVPVDGAVCCCYGAAMPQCTVGTPACNNVCVSLGSILSVCGYATCPLGYSSVIGEPSCSSNAGCDRCCCLGGLGYYDAANCQALSQGLGFTHSQITPDGHEWNMSAAECFNYAMAHCIQYHNGGSAPFGGQQKNCCYWYCSGETYNPPGGMPPMP